MPFGKAKITGVVWNEFEKKTNKSFLIKQVLQKLHVPSLKKKLRLNFLIGFQSII